MSKAVVSYEIVSKIKNDNENIISNLNIVGYSFSRAVDELTNECDSKINAYNRLLSKVSDIERKASNKLSGYTSNLSSAKSQASSTPKTIKETSVDSEGNSVTRNVNNPAYAAAQSNLNRAQQNVTAATNCMNNISIYKKNIESRLQSLNSFKKSIEEVGNSAKNQVNKIEIYTEAASKSFDKILAVIESYTNKNI